MSVGNARDVRAGGAYVEVYAKGVASLNTQLLNTERQFKSFGKSASSVALAGSRISETLNRSMWLLSSGIGNVTRSMQQMASVMTSSIRTARNYSVAISMAGVGGWAKILSGYAKYESQMATLRAVTDASDDQFARLDRSVRGFGERTRYTATEIAQLQTELARAGQSIQDVIRNTEGTIQLAITGETSPEEAAKLAASITNATGESMDKIADLLAKGANISTAEVIDLANSFRYVSAAANMTNADIEKTMTMLSLLSNYNMRGTTGGRSLSQAMVRTSSKANRKRIRSLGVEIETSSGQLRSFEHILFDIYAAFDRLNYKATDRMNFMSQTFGQVGMRAADIIGSNRREFEGMYKEMNNATGAAAAMAEIMAATLLGDVKRLASAFQKLQILLGEQIAPIVKPILVGLTGIAQTMNKLVRDNPEFAQKVFVLTGAFVVMTAALTAATTAMGILGIGLAPIALAALAAGSAVNALVFAFGGLSGLLSTGLLATIDLTMIAFGGLSAVFRGGVSVFAMLGNALASVGGIGFLPVLGQVAHGINIIRLILWTLNGFTADGNGLLKTLNMIMYPLDQLGILIAKGIGKIFSAIVPGFAAGVMSIGKIINLLFATIVKAVGTTIKILGSGISAFVSSVSRLLDVFRENPNFLNDYFTVLIDLIKNGDWQNLGEMMKRTFDTIAKGVKYFATVFTTVMKTMFELVLNELRGLFDQFKATAVLAFLDTKEALLQSVGMSLSREDHNARNWARSDLVASQRRTEEDRASILSGSTNRYDTATSHNYDMANLSPEDAVRIKNARDVQIFDRMSETMEPSQANIQQMVDFINSNQTYVGNATLGLLMQALRPNKQVASRGRMVDVPMRDQDRLDLLSQARNALPISMPEDEMQKRIAASPFLATPTIQGSQVSQFDMSGMLQNNPILNEVFMDFQDSFKHLNNPISIRADELREENYPILMREGIELGRLGRQRDYASGSAFDDANYRYITRKREMDEANWERNYQSLYGEQTPPEYKSVESTTGLRAPTFKQSDLEMRSSVGTFSSFNFGQLQQTSYQKNMERMMGSMDRNLEALVENANMGAGE